MEKEKGIIIVGEGIGKRSAIELAKRNDIQDLHIALGRQPTDPIETFKITRLPEFNETTYVDTTLPKFNYNKDIQTRLKNRKARKKKKRK